MGAFDDLIPEKGAAAAPAAGGGTFDDLIPPSREQELRKQYLEDQLKAGEPGYTARLKDSATLGLIRPIGGLIRGVGGVFDPTSTFGERYRAGVGAEEDYARRAEENTKGAGGVATDILGGVASAPAAGAAAGRAALAGLVRQGAGAGAVEGAARNAEDVGSAIQGAVAGGALGGATAGAIGAAARPFTKGAQAEVRAASRGESPEEIKAAAGRIYKQLDEAGLAYAQPQTKDLKKGLDDLVAGNRYNEAANPTLKGYFNQLDQLAQQPQGVKFTELNNIRSALAEQARGPDPSTRRAAGEIIGEIDKLVQNRPAINPTNLADVDRLHETARKAWKAASLAEDVGWTAGKAERKVASKAGVNPDEANRGAFRAVEDRVSKPGAYDPFTSDQRALLSRIVQGDKGQNALRAAGTVVGSPTTRLLLGGLAGGAGLTGVLGPAGAVAGSLGAAGGGMAKRALDRAAAGRGEQNIDALIRSITAGSRVGAPTAPSRQALAVLMARRAAQREGGAYAGSKLGD